VGAVRDGDRIPVDPRGLAAVLEDVSFVVPKKYRSDQGLAFLKKQPTVNYISPRVFLAIPGSSGDSVFSAPANLEVDAAGRIVGMAGDGTLAVPITRTFAFADLPEALGLVGQRRSRGKFAVSISS